jgi:hypothetical protein
VGELTLTVLKAEVTEDCRILRQTAALARTRCGSGSDLETFFKSILIG